MTDATAAPAPVEDLIKDLHRVTEQLWVESLSPPARHQWKRDPQLVNTDFLDRLLHLVRAIAKQTKRKKVNGIFTWGAFDHVQRQLPRTPLLRSIDSLVAAYASIPEEPIRRLKRECTVNETGRLPAPAEVSLVLQHIQRNDIGFDPSKVNQWALLKHFLPFASDGFQRAEKLAAFAPPEPRSPSGITAHRMWALFVDLVAQQADWEHRFGRHRRLADWLADLHNDDFTARISHHLRNPHAKREDISKTRKAVQAVNRTRAWRTRKSSGGPADASR
jgi:hypothetical protein